MKAKILLVAMLMAGMAFSAYVQSPSYNTLGRSVSISMSFNITGRTSDNLTGSNDFVAASSPNAVLALVSTGFGTRYDVDYSSDEYAIESRAPAGSARFFLVFAPGNSTVVSGKIESLKIKPLPGRTFGSRSITEPESREIFLRLEYRDVNILNRLRLGPGSRKIEIRNEGSSNGITNVSIEALK